MIFKDGTILQLGLARILVFGILVLDLLLDDVTALASMPFEAFLPHGILRLLPASWLEAMLRDASLSGFAVVYFVVLVLGLVGFGRAWLVTGAAFCFTVWFHGLARGFGGHVNHQELIVLMCLLFFLSQRSYAAASINSLIRPASAGGEDNQVARLLLRGLCFWILFTYFMIGVARLQASDWRVYQTNIMTCYVLLHSIKWNYWDVSVAKELLQQPLFDLFLRVSFPLATILELVAPFAVMIRGLVWPIVISLWLFHLAIFFTMNIFFWQNMLLLLLPLLGWYTDRNWKPATADGKPLIVFYDAACGLCDGFIRHVATRDYYNLLRFAPLDGATAKKHHIELPERRELWTIIAFEAGRSSMRSDAALTILGKTPLWADFASLSTCVPRFIRDAVYRTVARWRHLVPLRDAACKLPPQELRAKLLP